MSVLPSSIPAKVTKQLADALKAAGVEFTGTLKPGSRIQYVITHQDRTWTLGYLMWAAGEPWWKLTGPGCEHGRGVSTAEAVAMIAAPEPEPEPEPADPYHGVPRTHLGIKIPDFVRAAWDSELAKGWCLGVASAVGKLPANRPRS